MIKTALIVALLAFIIKADTTSIVHDTVFFESTIREPVAVCFYELAYSARRNAIIGLLMTGGGTVATVVSMNRYGCEVHHYLLFGVNIAFSGILINDIRNMTRIMRVWEKHAARP